MERPQPGTSCHRVPIPIDTLSVHLRGRFPQLTPSYTSYLYPPAMPPKPESELTVVEQKLLQAGARLFSAARHAADNPLAPNQVGPFNAKVRDEFVRIKVTHMYR